MRDGSGGFTHIGVDEGNRQMFLPPSRGGGEKSSHVEDHGQRRGEGAAVSEREGNVQGDHFDADRCPVAAARGGEEPAGGQDDAVALPEGDQQQVVQAS